MAEASRLRALHNALAVRSGEPVPFDDLVRAVWPDAPPANPRAALRNLVSRLRRTDEVVTEPLGYRLVVRPPGPSQLPADLPDFVGRGEELRRALDSDAGVLAVTGPPGVGKTSFAVHLAHLMRAEFPDGQLHVNLRAFSPGDQVPPEQALARFLRALGAEHVPVDLDAQQVRFRELTENRRVLFVIDNATRGQLRPLLPGSPTCRVIVTSRTDLPEHEQIKLGVFDEREAHALLDNMRITGGRRDRAELIRLCANLPLALRIAGANLADRYLPDYVSELRGDDRLDALQIEGDAAVNATFDLSYRAQPVVAQRLFRLLALVPGHDFSVEGATALLGEDATEPLGQLVEANLVQRSHDRHSLHDLLRLYAEHLDAEATARARLFSYYLINAEAAARTLNREFFRLELPELPQDLPRHDLESEAAAVAWLDAERANIVAAVQQAGPDPVAWLLTDMLRGHFHFQAHHVDWFAAARAGLKAAQQAGQPIPQAVMHGSLGLAHWSTGNLADAVERYGKALDILRVHRDERVMTSLLINSGIVNWELGRLRAAARMLGEALEMSPDNPAILFNLGGVHLDLGPLSTSITHAMRALEIAEEQDLLVGRILALNAMVEVHQLRGDHDLAAEYLARADELRAGAPPGLVRRIPGLDSHALLAFVHGRTEEALDIGLQALAHAHEAHSAKDECDGYDTLGEIHRALGDIGQAMSAHNEALAISLKNGYLRGEVNALAGLAADHHAEGELGEALKVALHARDRAREGEMRVRGVRTLAVLARVQRSVGDHAAADETARAGLELAAETECHLWDRELLEVAAG
jgi:tetratricopeptide (TPR) repeat protein